MKSNIDNRLIWLNNEIIPINEAKINVLSPTSQFGANVFEGIRCYWNEDEKQLYAFRLKEHYKRLINSIKMMRFENKYSSDDFERALIDVVRADEYMEDVAVRQTVFLDGFGSWSSKGPISMFVAPIPKNRTKDDDLGMKCCISTWERINDKSLSPRIKVGANYINSRMAQLEANENGYDCAIIMNNNGKVSEGPGSCLFIIRDNNLITPPLTASVLESITRSTIMELAEKEMNLKVIERDIDRTELYISDEVFLCGSAMEIRGVISIDGFIVGDGKTGELTKKLRNVYLDVVTGKNIEYKKWLKPIY